MPSIRHKDHDSGLIAIGIFSAKPISTKVTINKLVLFTGSEDEKKAFVKTVGLKGRLNKRIDGHEIYGENLTLMDSIRNSKLSSFARNKAFHLSVYVSLDNGTGIKEHKIEYKLKQNKRTYLKQR